MARTLRIVRFLSIQALVLFLVVEIGLRVLQPMNDNVRILLYLPSVTTGFDEVRTLPELLGRSIMGFSPYEVFAGFVRNSRGFRTREYSTERPEGVRRIVVIGDSFTAECGGIPYSLMWHTLLERELQAADPAGTELLALGVPGVGPLFERRLWQLEGRRLEPQFVLLQVFVGNDFTDHYDVDLRPSAVASAARWSFAVRFFRNARRALAAREDFRAGADPVETSGQRGGYELPDYIEWSRSRKPLMTPERLLELEGQRIRLCGRQQEAEFRELLGRMTSVLRDLRDDVESTGARFAVVVIPDRFQVNDGERREILEHLGMSESGFFDWDMPQQELRRFFEREGIEWLDLLPAFREASAAEQLYAVGDIHWNLRGNEVAAGAIAAWLAPLVADAPR